MGRASVGGGRPPVPGQQGVEVAGQRGRQPGEYVAQVGEGLVAVGLGRGDDAVGDGRALAASIAADEQKILPSERDAAQCPLSDVVIDGEPGSLSRDPGRPHHPGPSRTVKNGPSIGVTTLIAVRLERHPR